MAIKISGVAVLDEYGNVVDTKFCDPINLLVGDQIQFTYKHDVGIENNIHKTEGKPRGVPGQLARDAYVGGKIDVDELDRLMDAEFRTLMNQPYPVEVPQNTKARKPSYRQRHKRK